jgi:hypothetical protein
MSTLRRDLASLRRRADDLLTAPVLRTPLSLQGSVPCVDRYVTMLLGLRRKVSPVPQHTTRSNSGLFIYEGAALGIRQLMVAHVAGSGEQLPPGFADCPPKMLCLMGINIQCLNMVEIPPTQVKDPEALEIIEAWADSGLGSLAERAFTLSHFPIGDTWTALTPQVEALA